MFTVDWLNVHVQLNLNLGTEVWVINKFEYNIW